MKNALFRYDSKGGTYKNMGDYVQSIAARQFVGNNAILLERDHLNEYDGEEVKLIMAAWWMHYPENWPPSENIKPLFISFHITPDKADGMLTEKGINYLKKYEPIGCRDKGTQRILQSKGVEAYFSGCLTLTLGESYQHNPIGKKIVFVDPYFDVPALNKPTSLIKPLLTSAYNYKKIKSISKKMYKSITLKSLIKSAVFYRTYSKLFSENLLLDADYYTHAAWEPSFKDEKEKFEHTDRLLTAYSQAAFVVTSRLHVSLPTVAMNVPTIFVQNEKIPRSPGRFEGLLEHVNCIKYESGNWLGLNGFEIPSEITEAFAFSNKNTHLKLAQDMSEECRRFIDEE